MMRENILLVYNPISGEGTFKDKLDRAVDTLQQFNYNVILHRTKSDDDLTGLFSQLKDNIHAVAAAGGDGTIHHVVNGMLKADLNHIPLGVIPVGTSNDVANYIGVQVENALEVIGRRNVNTIDLGQVNGTYFINVASGGFITDVPYTTSVKLKSLTGRLAYYLKGIEKLPNIKPIPAKISSPQVAVDEDILLFIVLNGSVAGGFKNLAPASMTDGKLDVLIFKHIPISKLVPLFVKILRGEHIEDPSLIYFKSEGPIEIDCPKYISSDLDGEKGPDFPLRIGLHHQKLPIFVPMEYNE